MASISICRWQRRGGGKATAGSSPSKAPGSREAAFLGRGSAWTAKDSPLYSAWDSMLVVRIGQWIHEAKCSFMGLSRLPEPESLETGRLCWTPGEAGAGWEQGA